LHPEQSQPKTRPARRDPSNDEGVYLLANDAVLQWLRACAASLRSFNPHVRVVVIPFDHNVEEVTRLAAHYRFEIWQGPALEWLGELGVRSSPAGMPDQLMRKLAAFWGPLERFLYLDVDTVVLMDVARVLAAISAVPRTLLFAHCDDHGGNLDEVYRPGPWRQRLLETNGSHFGSSGVWAASRGLLSPQRVTELAQAARPVSDEFMNGDQAFLNFCLDTTGTAVDNLHNFIDSEIVWAGVLGCVEAEGTLTLPDGGQIGLVHWAGYGLNAELPYRSLWSHWATRSSPRRRPWPRRR
jgi:hypothetical protein